MTDYGAKCCDSTSSEEKNTIKSKPAVSRRNNLSNRYRQHFSRELSQLEQPSEHILIS